MDGCADRRDHELLSYHVDIGAVKSKDFLASVITDLLRKRTIADRLLCQHFHHLIRPHLPEVVVLKNFL